MGLNKRQKRDRLLTETYNRIEGYAPHYHRVFFLCHAGVSDEIEKEGEYIEDALADAFLSLIEDKEASETSLRWNQGYTQGDLLSLLTDEDSESFQNACWEGIVKPIDKDEFPLVNISASIPELLDIIIVDVELQHLFIGVYFWETAHTDEGEIVCIRADKAVKQMLAGATIIKD